MLFRGFPPNAIDSAALFHDPSAIPLRMLGPYCPAVHVQKMSLDPFSRVVDYYLHSLLNNRQMVSIRKAWYIHEKL